MSKFPTVSNILQKKKASDTEGYIKLRIGIPGRANPLLYAYGYKISEKDWNAGEGIVKKANDKSSTINAEILSRKDEIEHLFEVEDRKGNKLTEQRIIDLVSPKKDKGSFLSFFSDYIELLRSRQVSSGYIKHFHTEYKTLRDFRENLSFDDITSELLEQYEKSLAGIKPTTLHTKMKRIKEVVDRAVGRGKIEAQKVYDYKLPKYEDPAKDYLVLEEVERIETALYGGEFDSDISMKKVAAYFLVECFGSIRISDWKTFKIEKLIDQDNFQCRAKKNGEPVYLPLSEFTRLRRITDYIREQNLVFDITDQYANRLLKLVAKAVKPKIEKDLTSHVGRRTFGTLLGAMGWNTSEIAEAMGITENIAKKYVKPLRDKVSNAAKLKGGL